MKATGIVRRIDDLGRIVIPKEIRRTLRIREGDPLEIFTDAQGGVVFRKFSPIGEMADFALQYAEVLHKVSGKAALICDEDKIVAVSGTPKRDYLKKDLSEKLQEKIYRRSGFISDGKEKLYPIQGGEREACAMAPIVAGGDVAGAVVLLSESGEKPLEADIKLTQAAAAFLARQMED